MKKYEYMTITVGFDELKKVEREIIDPVTKKPKIEIEKSVSLYVDATTYKTDQRGCVTRDTDRFETPYFASYRQHFIFRSEYHTWDFFDPAQPLHILAEFCAKFGVGGWHLVETKSGSDENSFGVAILEREV